MKLNHLILFSYLALLFINIFFHFFAGFFVKMCSLIFSILTHILNVFYIKYCLYSK